jgi:branched-chain amino acid transport system ATP-binding protein
MLEASGLRVAYGSSLALDGVSLSVARGEIVALIGHNGAGKTTLLRAAMGLVPIAAGAIRFNGRPARHGRTAELVRHGLAFVPQGRSIFRDLTVAENLAVALSGTARAGMSEADILALFPMLAERRGQGAGSLSGGQQQMLALALALAKRPELILLDEPSTGLAPVLVESVFATLARLQDQLETAFLVVDQNIDRLLAVASRAYVLKAGRLVREGAARALASDDLWKLF